MWVFYYMLGNIPPLYRFRVQSIQLLALANSSMISKYGIDKILKPIIDELKELESVSYIPI